MPNAYLLHAPTHGLLPCQGRKAAERSTGAAAVAVAGRDGELNRQRDHEWEPGRETEKRIRNR